MRDVIRMNFDEIESHVITALNKYILSQFMTTEFFTKHNIWSLKKIVEMHVHI